MKNKVISCDVEKCTGCQICDIACAAEKEKTFNPLLSRIRTIRIEPNFNLAITCLLCEDPPCVRACPRDALRKSEENGIILVDEDSCTGCGWCIQACDFGAVFMYPTKKVVVICDLCDGDPECIKACPKEALALVDVTREQVSQKMRLRAVSSRVP